MISPNRLLCRQRKRFQWPAERSTFPRLRVRPWRKFSTAGIHKMQCVNGAIIGSKKGLPLEKRPGRLAITIDMIVQFATYPGARIRPGALGGTGGNPLELGDFVNRHSSEDTQLH